MLYFCIDFTRVEYISEYVEIKRQLETTDDFYLQILLLAQHVSVHHYAHHHELENIIQVVAACHIWCS